MSAMRVLLINKYHYLKGGAERAYFDTARILAENGHTVSFFSMQHPKNEETKWSQYFVSPVDYDDSTGSPADKLTSAWRILWNSEAAQKLEALIAEEKPDVAHLHNIYHQLSPSILWTLKKHRIPVVMTLHDYKLVSPNYSLFVRGKIWEHTSGFRCIADRCVKNSFLKSAVCALEQWLHSTIGSYRLVDAFVAPSRFLIGKYRELGFKKEITLLPQPLIPFPSSMQGSRGEYFVFVGRLSEEKGLDFLLEAFKELPNEKEKLRIIGTGPLESHLRDRVMKENLANIELVGAQYGKDLEQLIQNSRAVILPSVWYENMPYVLVEALGAGKIVIAANLGGIPERIEHGVNGFLFEPGNVSALVKQIRSLATRDENEEKMSLKAFESISDLDPKQYSQKLVDLYQRLIQSKKEA